MYWIILIIILLTWFYYFCIVKPLQYWTRRGIPQKSVFGQCLDIMGSMFQLKARPKLIQDIYNDYPDARYFGSYQFFTPVLFVRDPELIKLVTVKDFDHFTDHKMFIPEDLEPLLSRNLMSLKGDVWKDMRATLSPSFTSSKMRGIFILMNQCAEHFVAYFKKENHSEAIDMKDAFTRYANDVIATTSFGIVVDSLTDRNNEFYLMGKKATNFRGFWKNMSLLVMLLFPRLSKLFGFSFFSKDVSQFFRNLVKTNIESREKNGIVRPDMIQLLMEARNGRLKHDDQKEVLDSGFAVIEESDIGKDEKRQKLALTDDDLTAQALIFFFAGFENISTVMCFIIYELSVNPDIQDTLREEIRQTFENCKGSLTYEALLKMKYLDMVVTETLRKWPTQIAMERVCVKPYNVKSVKDGESDFEIAENENVWFPVFGIHRDPQYYPDPERFDPERFSDENKGNINPYTYIPFGIGPRSCIGTRFALLEIKTILFNLLLGFEVIIGEKTRVPLRLAKDVFGLIAEDGFWFKLKPLKSE